ncbi:hypothetical protein Tco_0169252 [Tanacetum coccineum]
MTPLTKNLDSKINNIIEVLNVGIRLRRIQLDVLKVENCESQRRYYELSKANTHSQGELRTREKINALNC